MAGKQTVVPGEATKKIRNKTNMVINAGKIRLTPKGTPGDTIEVPVSKISEGLRRLLSSGTSPLEVIG